MRGPPTDTKERLLLLPQHPARVREADDIVCLEDHEFLGAIGFYYADFRQVQDEEVIAILKRFPLPGPKDTRQPAA